MRTLYRFGLGLTLVTIGWLLALLLVVSSPASAAPEDTSPLIIKGPCVQTWAYWTGDVDGDCIPNWLDNCTWIANLPQFDTDLDGYGNACDGDFDGNGVVNGGDERFLDDVLFSDFGDSRYDSIFDADCDGSIDQHDIEMFHIQMLVGHPGPNGPPSAPYLRGRRTNRR